MVKTITPDGETDEFSIQAGVLQGDTLAPYVFITVLGYCQRMSIDNNNNNNNNNNNTGIYKAPFPKVTKRLNMKQNKTYK